jgi:hypothetical protein
LKYEKALKMVPFWMRRDLGAELVNPPEARFNEPHWGAVEFRKTTSQGGDSQKINVIVLDEHNHLLPLHQVAFTWDTGPKIEYDEEWNIWMPSWPWQGVVPMASAGHVELVLGADGVVEPGGRGGIGLHMFDPNVPSVEIKGLGMTGDHVGVWVVIKRFGLEASCCD